MNEIRYAELFAGVGGFREGIQQSGLPSRCTYANEIDKHASAVYRHIWRTNEELIEGDIREQKTKDIPEIDFLTAGFPCQSFSVAGKRLGMADTRGTLFFEVARVLADKRPRHFLLENVKGLLSHDSGKTIQTMLGILTDLGYRVEWEVLNSTCWVPQNRERIFVVGHLRGECGCQVFPLREDGEVYPCAHGQDSVVSCLDSNYWKGWLDKGQRTMVVQIGHRAKGKPRFYDGAIPAMTQDYGTGGQNVPLVVERPHGYNQSVVKSGICLRGEGRADQNQFVGVPVIQGVAYHQNKSKTVTSHDEAMALRSGASHSYQGVAPPNSAMSLDTDGYLRLTGARLGDENGKPQLLPIGYRRFRRLTPIECERLQGWPDNHTALGLYLTSTLPKSKRNGDEYTLQPVSDTQRYRMTGNGVTADVVREVVKKMIAVGCFE